nr:MAG TPA: hypothetical protein [Caudoviricetes sp.]
MKFVALHKMHILFLVKNTNSLLISKQFYLLKRKKVR